MAKEAQKRKNAKAGLATKLVIVLLLAAIGWQLYDLQDQVKAARAEKEAYAQQVAKMEKENEELAADIAEGPTPEKMEEIAREELNLVTPGEYAIYDISN